MVNMVYLIFKFERKKRECVWELQKYRQNERDRDRGAERQKIREIDRQKGTERERERQRDRYMKVVKVLRSLHFQNALWEIRYSNLA